MSRARPEVDDVARIDALRGEVRRLHGEVQRLERDNRILQDRVALLVREIYLRDATTATVRAEPPRPVSEDEVNPRPRKPILQHLVLVLANAGMICARCLGGDAGVEAEDVMQHLQIIAATISITIDYAVCRACRKPNNLFSFGDGGGES